MKTLIIIVSFLSSIWAFDVKQLDGMVLPDYIYPGVVVEFNGEIGQDKDVIELGLLAPNDLDSAIVVRGVDSPTAEMTKVEPIKRGNENWIVAKLRPGKFRIIMFYTPFEPMGKREFDFIFKSDRNLEAAHLGVQKPISILNWSLQLNGAEASRDQHGNEVFNSHLHDYRAGTAIPVKISYNNPTGGTTMEALRAMLNQQPAQPQMTAPAPVRKNTAPVRHKLPTWEPLLAMVVVFVVAFYMYNNRPVKKVKATSAKGKKNFCSSCGTKVEKNSKFCSSCGEKLG